MRARAPAGAARALSSYRGSNRFLLVNVCAATNSPIKGTNEPLEDILRRVLREELHSKKQGSGGFD